VSRACSLEFNAVSVLVNRLTLNGSNAINGFYRPSRAAVDETVDIEFTVMAKGRRGWHCRPNTTRARTS
jgi:hypothetical protein